MKKKLFLIAIVFFVCLMSLSASGSKENTGKRADNATIDALGTNAEWIYLNDDGSYTYVKKVENEDQPIDSVGYRYTDKKGTTVTVYTTEEQNLYSSWMTSLANALDNITFRLVMAIHPFPNILFQMYDTTSFGNSRDFTMKSDDRTAQFSTSDLLISNSFYDSTITSNNRIGNEWKVSIAEDASTTGSSSKQYTKWSVVTVLFVTFFVGEMLFMTIYGYVTGTTENVLKEIAKKAGITLALFLLVSALPFLVESMRYGFFRIAATFYGDIATNYYSDAGIEESLTDPGEVFQLPGSFVRQMRVFFSRITNTQGDQALSEAMGDSGKYNIFLKLLIWLLLLVFRFFMFFVVLKAALHIAVNVIEVYLLLGLTMILVPFSTFEPLKPVGAKCVMSLVSNVLECFILIVILTCIVPSCVIVCSELLDGLSGYQNEDIYVSQLTVTECPGMTEERVVKDNLIITGSEYSMLILDLDYVRNGNSNYRVGFAYIPSLDQNASTVTITANLANIADTEGIDYLFQISPTELTKVSLSGENESKFLKILANPCWEKSGADSYNVDTVFPETLHKETPRQTICDIMKVFYWNLNTLLRQGKTYSGSNDQRSEFVTLMAESLNSNKQFMENYNTVLNYRATMMEYYAATSANAFKKAIGTFQDAKAYTRAAGTVTKSQSKTATFFGQLLICFMAMYIPCFFVQQSTQITNSLMNGTAAMESFANATGNMLKTVGQGVKTLATWGAQLAGTGAKLYNNHYANAANKAITENNKQSSGSGTSTQPQSPQGELQQGK